MAPQCYPESISNSFKFKEKMLRGGTCEISNKVVDRIELSKLVDVIKFSNHRKVLWQL